MKQATYMGHESSHVSQTKMITSSSHTRMIASSSHMDQAREDFAEEHEIHTDMEHQKSHPKTRSKSAVERFSEVRKLGLEDMIDEIQHEGFEPFKGAYDS